MRDRAVGREREDEERRDQMKQVEEVPWCVVGRRQCRGSAVNYDGISLRAFFVCEGRERSSQTMGFSSKMFHCTKVT